MSLRHASRSIATLAIALAGCASEPEPEPEPVAPPVETVGEEAPPPGPSGEPVELASGTVWKGPLACGERTAEMFLTVETVEGNAIAGAVEIWEGTSTGAYAVTGEYDPAAGEGHLAAGPWEGGEGVGSWGNASLDVFFKDAGREVLVKLDTDGCDLATLGASTP